MATATITVVVLLLVLNHLLGRRNARRVRTETPEQREKRIRDRKDTAVILSILDDR